MNQAQKVLVLGGVLSLTLANTTWAQDAAAGEQAAPFEEVVVTARKREESLQDVPIAITALGKNFIEQNNISSVQDVSAFTPGLIAGNGTGETGGNLFLRGVGSGELSALLDQSVALNVDGVQVGGQLMFASLLDLERIEVLRGPQALFFGKNSPGGVISITTAAPTDTFEARAQVGYEAAARQSHGQFVISGPLSDTLRGRAMVDYSTMDGYLKIRSASVDSPPFSATGFNESRGPNREEIVFRGSLDFQPSDRLRMTGKFTYVTIEADEGFGLNAQIVSCPTGTRQAFLPQYSAVEDCTPNDTIVIGNIPSNVLAQAPLLRNSATGFTDNDIYLGSLTINYDLTDAISLTSVTGIYGADVNMATSYSLQPTVLLASSTGLDQTQLSEELRILTDYDSPVNLAAGVYYEKTDALAYVNPNAPLAGLFATERTDQDRTAWSVFAQAIWNITDQIEFTGGARYSDEDKEAVLTSTLVPGARGKADYQADNVSPEFTLTYKPTDTLTVYGSYKEGFKSGGIDASFRAPTLYLASGGNTPITYDEEKAEGYELGIKTTLLDHTLAINVALFSYDYSDLQLSYLDTSTLSVRVVNAAGAETRGAEVDLTWNPAGVRGLTIRGAAAYLDAEYSDYIADCYNGQSIANGCSLQPDPITGVFQKQNLSGKTMSRAPKFVGTVGVDYNWPVFGDWEAGVATVVEYSDDYQTHFENSPYGIQDSFVRTNLTLQLMNEAWQLALIGRNLGDEYVVTRSSSDTLAAKRSGTAAEVPIDLFGSVSRGREVLFQVTRKF
ncbi:TonB-dependent receptor [Steroidobacter sp.]|uniref:TonB-dependent receptor n=1 Tax=Steroidobacter sp. TaxID=1978227 RepID=UPI001A6355D1|nr:TonB-dependent receptor [Steroidobacter sp.]MBL8271649.1 TonB-dependent receptor [Steroidobacter sp.]